MLSVPTGRPRTKAEHLVYSASFQVADVKGLPMRCRYRCTDVAWFCSWGFNLLTEGLRMEL